MLRNDNHTSTVDDVTPAIRPGNYGPVTVDMKDIIGVIFSWLYLKARSSWVAALAHGSPNPSRGSAVCFLKPGFETAWG